MKLFQKKSVAEYGIGLLILFAITITTTINANNNHNLPSIFDQMQYKEVLELTLETDVENLKLNRRSEAYQKATLRFEDQNEVEQSWEVKLKIRGRFRRMNCSEIPPLKIKFKKDDLEVAGLAPFNDMKLVTHCISDKFEASSLLKKEFLAYKLYNELSPYSFRVQMLKITFKDSKTGKKTKQWAFLIEDFAQLRARIDGQKKENVINIPREAFQSEALKQVALFQYMIGNPDWDLRGARNLKMIVKNGKVIPVPYDFDFSGLVNAPYAIPVSEFGMVTVRDRVYLGFAKDINQLNQVSKSFLAKRKNLDQFVKSFKMLNRADRIDIRDYLDSFFEDINHIQLPGKATAKSALGSSSMD